MPMLRNLVSSILILCFVSTAFATDFSNEALLTEFNKDFKEILIDARGSRGGNGDVAAGYLTSLDLIKSYGFNGNITILVDRESSEILARLAKNNSSFYKSVNVETMGSLPNKTFDLYLALASPSGSFHYGNDLKEKTDQNKKNFKISDVLLNKIKISEKGILIVQTVLGNTENQDSINPFAIVRHKGINYRMSPAGIGKEESGIYRDYVAEELKDKNTAEVVDYIRSELPTVNDNFSRGAIQEIMDGEKLKGSNIGLAYGITQRGPQKQFFRYLQGLALDNTKAHVIITPSGFSEKLLMESKHDNLKDRVKVISKGDLPEVADPGVIYIVKVKTLPHKVFVGLIAYSMKAGLVPVGAGDGFMSAAINLGGPFVLTRVSWNAKNIENLQRLLLFNLGLKEWDSTPEMRKEAQELLVEIYSDIKLHRAQELKSLAWSYKRINRMVPNLTQSIINASVLAKSVPAWNGDDYAKHANQLRDKVMISSFMYGGAEAELATAIKFSKYLKSIKNNYKEKWEALIKMGFSKNLNEEIKNLSLIQKFINIFVKNNLVETGVKSAQPTMSAKAEAKYMTTLVDKNYKGPFAREVKLIEFFKDIFTKMIPGASRPYKAEELKINSCKSLFA